MYTDRDGYKYWGEWSKATNKKQGRGVKIYTNGIIYEGYCMNGN
jgi:hypothetical protein